MSKNFAGTVTLDSTVYSVAASLTKNGRRIVGTVTFDLDETKVMPVNYLIDATGLAFSTASSIWFADPAGNAVEVLSLSITNSSVDADFTAIDVVGEDCNVAGVLVAFEMDLDEVVAVEEDGSVVDAAAAAEPLTRKTLEPIRINEVGNTSDHFGGLVSITRLSEESNADYIKRIRDAVANPGGAHYMGMINGLNRQLNVAREDAIRVTLSDSPTLGEDKARFFLNEKECIIYDEWMPVDLQQSGVTPVVEMQTELKGMTVGKLVDWINTSANYSAVLTGTGANRAENLITTDSRRMLMEELDGQEIMVLTFDNVVPGTLMFRAVEELEQEIDIGDALTTRGQYKIDYSNGHVKSYSAAPAKVKITYTTNRRTFDLVWSPIKISDFTSEGGQDLYFNQVTREFYTTEVDHYVNGLPTNEAYGIMRDILTAGKFPQFWGE